MEHARVLDMTVTATNEARRNQLEEALQEKAGEMKQRQTDEKTALGAAHAIGCRAHESRARRGDVESHLRD